VKKLGGEMLIVRADASVAIGTGHVMRCLALGQAWKDKGGQAIFAMADSTPAISERLLNENIRPVPIDAVAASDHDLEQTIALAHDQAAAWVVTDGYHFGAHYHSTLKNAGLKVLAVDDNGNGGPYTADFVLNQNIHARADLYHDRAPHTRLLLGTQYALLRREFLGLCEYQREIAPVARKLLVAMGGSDPGNVTLLVLDAIDQVHAPELEVLVVAGGSNPHMASLSQRAARCRYDCRIVTNVTNMKGLIIWADLAISAAGTACWEYCLAGLPAILLAVAENQIPAAETLHAAGAAVLIGDGEKSDSHEIAESITRLLNSPKERQSMSHRARALVDGRGAERTVSALLRESFAESLKEDL